MMSGADRHDGPAGPVRPAWTQPGPGRVRLQKLLSDAGVASRRHAEELILEGRVLVNDAVVDSLPAFVDPERDRVYVGGARVRAAQVEYWLLYKPKGVVCTNRDPAGRVRAIDLMPDDRQHLFPVGRLDADSSGLLLMTNDGELAQRIAHPSSQVPKVYRVEIKGDVPADLVARMKSGVRLAEGRASASEVEVLYRGHKRSVLRVTLRECRNRQVRRMLARFGCPVRDLLRIEIGPLELKGLPVGAARRLSNAEAAALRRAVEAHPTAGVSRRGPKRARPAPRRTDRTAPRGAAAPPARAARRAGSEPAPRRRLIK